MSAPMPPQYNPYPQNPVIPKNNGLAIAGFVTSLLCCSIVGLVLSIIGLNQINKEPMRYTGKGFAIAGIIISGIGLLLTVIYWGALMASISNS